MMTTRKEIKAVGEEISLEAGLLASLTDLRDTLKVGERLDKKYTVRTVEIEFEPRDYTPKEITKLREELFKSSQAVFAQLIGVKTKTLQSWEHGRKPPKIARRLFDMMSQNPPEWLKLLKQNKETQPA